VLCLRALDVSSVIEWDAPSGWRRAVL
jgi:hypothetical protein